MTLLSSRTWASARLFQPSPKEPWPPPAHWLPRWWWGGAQRSRLCSPSLESRQPVQREPRANGPPRPKWQYCPSARAHCSRGGQPGEHPLSLASPRPGQLGGRQRPRVGPTQRLPLPRNSAQKQSKPGVRTEGERPKGGAAQRLRTGGGGGFLEKGMPLADLSPCGLAPGGQKLPTCWGSCGSGLQVPWALTPGSPRTVPLFFNTRPRQTTSLGSPTLPQPAP